MADYHGSSGVTTELCKLAEETRHKPVALIFRDAVESIDVLLFFHSGFINADLALRKWYENETISHGEVRRLIKQFDGAGVANQRGVFYQELSRFTHRTHRVLLHSGSLGRDDLLVHDSHGSGHLVLPEIIAVYMTVLVDITIQAIDSVNTTGLLSFDEVAEAWDVALENHTIPRRFAMCVN